MCCTMTIGSGKSAGSCDRVRCNALGPPVLAPITITSGRDRPLNSGTGGRVTGAGVCCVRYSRRAITRTADIAFSVCKSCWRRLGKSGLLRSGSLGSTASAPLSSARIESSTSVPTMPLTTTTGVGHVVMIARVASRPSATGILMSIVITSGRSCCASDTASAPSRASPTTRKPVSSLISVLRYRRTVGLSSAIRTRISSGIWDYSKEQYHNSNLVS